MLAIWLAMGMAVIDGAIANIALPTIAREVGATPAASIWVVNAYQIAVVMTLLPAAALGEIFGCRRVYLIGLAFFVAGSIGCTFATDLTTLAGWRFIEGASGAAIMGINAALVRFTYPSAFLGRGLGYNTLVIALASASGPTVAAAILAVAPWQALFAVNIPIGLAALVIGARALPLTPRAKRSFDFVSALLNALMFSMLFLAAADFARATFQPRTIGEILLGTIATVLLFRRMRRQAAPLVPLDLLGFRILRLSYFASSSCFAASAMAGIALPFFLDALGFDRVTIGLIITPLPISIALTAPIAGRLVERLPASQMGATGLALYAGAMLLLSTVGRDAAAGDIMWRVALSGVGFALFQTPNNRIMIGSSPPARSAAAAGMMATARLVGQTLGAVFVASMFVWAGPASPVPFYAAASLAAVAAVISLRRISAGPGQP